MKVTAPQILAISFIMATIAAQADERQITIRALDGRNGRPIRAAHLLIFAGNTPADLRSHQVHFDLMTDHDGAATLSLIDEQLKYLQVWVDGETLCQAEPNATALSIDQISLAGLAAPNNCGATLPGPKPKQLLLFARPSTLSEKMRR